MRLCVSLSRRLSAFFGSISDQDPKAAKFAVLIPGPGMLVNVRNAPRVVIPPPSETPPVSACKPLCAILLRKPSVYPLSPVKANVGRLCERLKNAMKCGLEQRCAGNFLAIFAGTVLGEKPNFTGRFFEWRRPFDFSKIKGRSRKRPRPGHKAPQCGAFRRVSYRRRFCSFEKIPPWFCCKRLLPQEIPAAFTAVYGLLRDLEEVWNKRTD